jgi:hypothetical protein
VLILLTAKLRLFQLNAVYIEIENKRNPKQSSHICYPCMEEVITHMLVLQSQDRGLEDAKTHAQ